MGYDTNYELTIEEGSLDDIDKVVEDLKLLEADLGEDLFPDCGLRNDWWSYMYDVWRGRCDSASWYDHDKYMLEFSKRHPTIVFKLHGEGEEAGDLWDAYYKNGKMQECRAEIYYPPYDETKLT